MGSAISTGVKVLAAILLSKIIAEKLGPSGLGLIGQLSSFVSITLLLASGSYQNGIVKFTALYKSDAQLPEFVKPSLKLTGIIAVVSGALLYFLSGFFSNLVFHSQEYIYVFYWLAFTIVLTVLITILMPFLTEYPTLRVLIFSTSAAAYFLLQ